MSEQILMLIYIVGVFATMGACVAFTEGKSEEMNGLQVIVCGAFWPFFVVAIILAILFIACIFPFYFIAKKCWQLIPKDQTHE